jgi:hypothetical protein
LFNTAEVSNLNKVEKMAYDASLKEKWDYYNSLDYMQKEGFDRGMEKGLKLVLKRVWKKAGTRSLKLPKP